MSATKMTNDVIQDQENWSTPTAGFMLGEGEVHIWRASLIPSPTGIQHLFNILDTDEQRKAHSYYFERDRERFIIARGALRNILSQYLCISPDQLSITYNSYGKPRLTNTMKNLSFNVSHSNDLALYAIAVGCEVGIDIEFIRDEFPGLEIAQQVFSQKEIDVLLALPSNLQTVAFFNCWTRKEAYIKARGEGLSHPLDQFTVSVTPGEPAALLSVKNDPLEVSRWWLHELRPSKGYMAAIALQGGARQIRLWQWKD